MQDLTNLTNTVLDNQARLDRIEQRVDTIANSMVTRDEYLHSHDQIMTILRRLDDERVTMIEWLKRHDRQLERLQA